MDNEDIPPEDFKNLLEENLRLTREIHEMTKKVKSYMTFQKVLSVFYLLLFVIPIVLSIIYLPVFIREYLAPYQEILNGGSGINNGNPQDIGDILDQAQKIINNK